MRGPGSGSKTGLAAFGAGELAGGAGSAGVVSTTSDGGSVGGSSAGGGGVGSPTVVSPVVAPVVVASSEVDSETDASPLDTSKAVSLPNAETVAPANKRPANTSVTASRRMGTASRTRTSDRRIPERTRGIASLSNGLSGPSPPKGRAGTNLSAGSSAAAA